MGLTNDELQARLEAIEAMLNLTPNAHPDQVPAVAVDSPIVIRRADVPNVPPGHTTQAVTVLSYNSQKNSYAWPIYVQLRVTNHPQATVASSQSTGTQVRMYSAGSGSPWAAGNHIEVHHGQDSDGSNHPDAAGLSIGENIEITRTSPKGYVIGWNIQQGGDSVANADVALQVQSNGPGKRFTKTINIQDNGRDVADLTFDVAKNKWLLRKAGVVVASW